MASQDTIKIGAFAHSRLFKLLEEDRIPDFDFDALCTIEGTKELLGHSMSACPLFAFKPIVRQDGRSGSWSDTANRNGKAVYVNSQWHESHRANLERLLSRWEKNNGKVESSNAVRNPSRKHEVAFLGRVAGLLQESFPNGIRPHSIIDRNKFKKHWLSKYSENFDDEIDLQNLLPQVGVMHDGMVFPNPIKTGGTTLVEYITNLAHAQRQELFYYNALFDAKMKPFVKMGILSGDMLKSALRQTAPDAFNYGRTSFSMPKHTLDLAETIKDVFAVKDEWSKSGLSESLPFVPVEKISHILANTKDFVRVAEGVYRLASSILFDDNEAKDTIGLVARAVDENGFYSLAESSFTRSMEMNGEMYRYSFLVEFYDRYLAADYDRHGLTVCRKGANYDSQTALRDYCRKHDDVTLEQLAEQDEALGLGGGAQSIITAHEEMVRVSEDRFVSPRLVRFDKKRTERAIAAFMKTGIAPLSAFDSFALFPPIAGFPWNRYLLESYLRRESQDYAYMAVSAATNAIGGAVVCKSSRFETFADALAVAVVNDNVELTETAVGEYLLKNGYIQRRRGIEKKVAEIARRQKGIS